MAATAGTKPSLTKETFFVRLPMIRFLSSLRALSWTSESGEFSRVKRSELAPVAVVEVGIVSLKPIGCHAMNS